MCLCSPSSCLHCQRLTLPACIRATPISPACIRAPHLPSVHQSTPIFPVCIIYYFVYYFDKILSTIQPP